MHEIYLHILIRTGTRAANVIDAVTGDCFAHASISLDRELTQLYSFARRGVHNPLRSGFEKENIHRGIFAIFGDCYSHLYRLTVTDATYECIRETLHTMYQAKYDYRYNFVGLFSCALGIPSNFRHHYTCSQFVSWMLEYSGAAVLPKNMGLMKPDDLAGLPEAELIYKGRIADADAAHSGYPIVPFFNLHGKEA